MAESRVWVEQGGHPLFETAAAHAMMFNGYSKSLAVNRYIYKAASVVVKWLLLRNKGIGRKPSKTEL